MEINYFDFDFKPFGEMTPEDYAKIGFKSGLEVHQQLLTKTKLFCRCPAGQFSDEYNTEILRHMRPTLSELGEYDGTALMEFKTKKEIIYRINYNTVCTYEMDDTPPFMMSDEALDAAIEASMLYGANIVDEVHIARKQYLDGSIPTGFQRTAIVSIGGAIDYNGRKINLIQMSIEEDSCREVSDVGHRRVYITDRLGMPLIETVTYPEMKTPQEVADVNQILSRIVKSTGKVRTGVGAARQDVNVSVTGGTRIEIKGVSSIKSIPLLTYNEAMRQWNLLKLRQELWNRGITEETFSAKYEDVTNLMRKTRYTIINNAISNGLRTKCVVLRGFKGLLRWQTQTDTYFSREISDRVKVIACLNTLPNIVHSDAMSEQITSTEWTMLRKATNATENDTLVLVWGDEQDSTTACKEIIIRAKEATIGVPSETRQAHSDGTNGFERILPGPERMYPDTDLPPIKITQERFDRIKANLKPSSWDIMQNLMKEGFTESQAEELSLSKYYTLYEKLLSLGIDKNYSYYLLIQLPKSLSKKNLDFSKISQEDFLQMISLFINNKLNKSGLEELIKESLVNGKFTPELVPNQCDGSELDGIINEAISEFNNLTIKNLDVKVNVIMGIIMKKLQGRIEGKIVRNALLAKLNN